MIVKNKSVIVQGLRNLGVEEGYVILVHSSLSSFGYVQGGADTVISALLESVGASGTVVVPTLTGNETLSYDNPPVFDLKHSTALTGSIPEHFRKYPNAIRSSHPTHSVAAIGPLAEDLTSDHIYSITPCDKQSPYGKIANLENGYILLLGVDHSSNTTMHHVEEIAGVDYHIQPGFVRATIVKNNSKQFVNIMIHKYGSSRNFNIIEPLLIERGAQVNGIIGNSKVKLINSRKMVDIAYRCLMVDKSLLIRK